MKHAPLAQMEAAAGFSPLPMARLEEELISFPVYSSDDPMACGNESIINGQLALLDIFHVHPEFFGGNDPI